MENLKLPASPFFEWNKAGYGEAVTIEFSDGSAYHIPYQTGFTKLEKASLMIAQGMLSGPHKWEKEPVLKAISVNAVAIAKAVLEEANK